MFRRARVLAALSTAVVSLVSGCEAPDPRYGEISQAATVESFETSTCSTSVVLGLSIQIAEEVNCLMPGQLVEFAEVGNVVFNGAAVLPYMAEAARDDLYAAAESENMSLLVNSAFRTVAQQYLLRRWFELGRCGITAAAQPGSSNHESGRAVDISNWPDWIDTLAAFGWDQTVPGDEVHFDHLESPDIRGADVLAFQRLWNRNNPDQLLDEDGDYGAMTATRLAGAPAEGFALGADCSASERSLEVLAVVGPESLAPGEAGMVIASIRNSGGVAWSPTTQLATATGAPSVFADLTAWTTGSIVTTLDVEVAPGDSIDVTIPVIGPALDVTTTLGESFRLIDGSFRFGAIPITIVVETGEDPGEEDPAGCCDGGGVGAGGLGGAVMVALALWPKRRGRRRRGNLSA